MDHGVQMIDENSKVEKLINKIFKIIDYLVDSKSFLCNSKRK